MYVSPTIVCVNERIDSPRLETAPSTIEQTSTLVLKESSRIGELGLGSINLFDSEGEDEDQLYQKCDDSVDLLALYGKRLLWERPVKPLEKAKELQLQSISQG